MLGNGQSHENIIDNDYFLLGTLNDYMGREKYKEIDYRVDAYSQNHASLAFYLDSVFKDAHPDLIVTVNKKTNRIELYSESLAQRMDDFYYFQATGRGSYNRQDDLRTLNLDSLTKTPDFLTTHFDTIFTGRIDEGIFRNDSEIFSFIAGAYMRFGGKMDSLYYIDITNSLSKVRVLNDLLKEIKCTNVEYVMKKGYIPVGHTVYFTPTDKLEEYFEITNRDFQCFNGD